MKKYSQSLLLIGVFSNVVPIVLSTIYFIQGGDDWGGKMPLLINLTFIFIILTGMIGLVTMIRVFYLLNLKKNYDGSQSSIKAIIFVSLFYLIMIIMSGVTISQYINHTEEQGCSINNIFNLWDQDVYEEGNQAYNNFCHRCKCKISQKDLSYYSFNLLSSLNYSTEYGAEDISQCKPEEGHLYSSTFEKLQKMEKNYNCAGFCSNSPTFTFLGTSNGPPQGKEGCFRQVSQDFSKIRIIIVSVNCCLFILMTSCFIASIYLRKIKLNDIINEYKLKIQEPFMNSVIGESKEEQNEADSVSQSSKQKSSYSHNYNNTQNNLKSHHSDSSSNFGQSQQLEKTNENIEKMKKFRKAFNSMNNPRSTLKK